MRRKRRYMKGSLQQKWYGKTLCWCIVHYEGESRRTYRIGPVAEISRAKAEAERAKFMLERNEALAPAMMTFGEYVEVFYIPKKKQNRWKESTEQTATTEIRTHLVSELCQRRLDQITRIELQEILDRRSKSLSRDVAAHLRWHLQAIFATAKADGFVTVNVAEALEIPRNCKASQPRRVLSIEQVHTYLDVLDLRERAIAALAIFSGMRPGEILALRWPDIAGDVVDIERRVYRGIINTPKADSERAAIISETGLEALRQLRELATDLAGYVFPSEAGTPLRRDNLWRRYFKPKLKAVGLEWATFQILRRTNASIGHKKGADPAVGAAQRGHGIGVAISTYTQPDLEQKRQWVRLVEGATLRNPKQAK